MKMTTFQKLLAPLTRRVRLMVGRGIIKLVYDDLKAQGIQISLLNGEIRDQVERFQEYGFTSHPVPGAEAVMVCVGGNRDHGIIIACEDRRYRLTGLLEGEVALYDKDGNYIKLGQQNVMTVHTEGTLVIEAASAVSIDTPSLTVTGNIGAEGNVSDGTRSMSGDRTIYNSHTHPETGSTTGAPNQSQ